MKLKLIGVVFALLLSSAFASAMHAQDNCARQRFISVTGTSEVRVAPDEAVLLLGVDSRNPDLAAAKAENDQSVKKAIALIHDAGIEPKYVQTSELTMRPEYSEERRPRLIGYEVSQSISITLKDLSKYEALMTHLLEAGVNRVEGVEFRVAEPRKYKDEARAKAIQAAREKAVAMATELGQTVGKPWQISEQGSEDVNGGMSLNVQSGFDVGRAGTAEEPTIAPGEVVLRASVNVSFDLE